MKDILKRWTFKKDKGWWFTEKSLKVLNSCEVWLTFKKIPEQLRSCLRKEQDRAQQGSSTDLVYGFSCVIKKQVFVRMLSKPKDFMKQPKQTLSGLHENMQFHYKIKFAEIWTEIAMNDHGGVNETKSIKLTAEVMLQSEKKNVDHPLLLFS